MTNSRVEYLFQMFDWMPDNELRKELKNANLNTHGTRSQLLKRLRTHYRKDLVNLRKKNPNKSRTQDFYDYFIAIDFECTCEENNYDFDHEIIEFPAVMVSANLKRIVDKFHTYVRPTHNSVLSEFCIKFTGITQEMVNDAPTFPVALKLFRGWMAKHGLDGEGSKGRARRFCYVTDGPWDIAKFFQMQCQKSHIGIPHDFRCFMNIRRAFYNYYCYSQNGREVKPLPKMGMNDMLQRLDLEFEGREHCGLDDTKNIARILVRMLDDDAELRVNEKLVLGTKLQDWQKLVFDESAKAPHLELEFDEENGTIDSTCQQLASHFQEKLRICSSDSDKSGEHSNRSTTIVWQKWWDLLPYKLVKISRIHFLGELHMECETCDEDDD